MNIKSLIRDVPILQLRGSDQTEILGLSLSSGSIEPGFLFAALKGMKADGHDHIPDAAARGAAAVLSERPPDSSALPWIQVENGRRSLALCSANFYGHPSRRIKVVGITGTKGKTTTTYILESILKAAGRTPGVIGTIAYRGPGLEHPAERTTPEAPDLQKMLCTLIEHGASDCVMEVSSHSLSLCRVDGIDFTASVFTNLSGDHLDYHVSMENYFAAKKKLFDTGRQKQIAVINVDNPWGRKLQAATRLGVISYGLEAPALVRAASHRFSDHGMELNIEYPGGRMDITSPLLGKPNLYNILASVAAALALKITPRDIKSGVHSLQGVPGRFQNIPNNRGVRILVDYAHTDDALRNLLETTRELAPRRILLVFGAGGDRDKTKRPRMGKVASALADWTILTSDNPRSEDPMMILKDIESGMEWSGGRNYEVEPDRRKAISRALLLAKPGDVVLVAGKGHEDYQILKDDVIHFSDSEVITEILNRQGQGGA